MAMMVDDHVIWVLDKLGFSWPDVDEDELRRGADILRRFGSDIEDAINAVDRRINLGLTDAMRGQAGPAYVAAWNNNRSQNLQQMVDLIGPMATGTDIFADVVFAMKSKCLIELAAFFFKLAAAFSAVPVGAGVAASMIIVEKKAMEFAVNCAVDEVMSAITPLVLEPVEQMLPGLMNAILDAPLTEAVAGNPDEFYADLDALDAAQGDMRGSAADVDTLTANLLADLGGLRISGS